jgi:hypothetical protein
VAKGVKQATVGSRKGLSMSTTVLAYVILFMGFITFPPAHLAL